MPIPGKSNYRILLVDDHREFIDRLISRIQKTDPAVEFTFDFAMSGEEAMKKVQAFLPDVILLDNMLADEDSSFSFVNARDFYGALKAEGFHGIPVIVITYDPDVYNVRELLNLGVKAVFGKDDLFCVPDECEKLVQLIKNSG